MDATNKNDRRNTVKVFTSVLKLVEAIKLKVKAVGDLPANDKILLCDKVEELRELKNLCCSEDAVISLTACQGFVSLVQTNCLPLQYTLTFLQSSIIGTRKVRGISSAVLNLLILDLRSQLSQKGVYENPVPASKNHPLCRLLRQNSDSWRDVLNQMASVFNHENKMVSDNALVLLKPVFTFILLEYSDSLSDTCLHHTWKLMVEKAIHSEKETVFELLASSFFQSEKRDPLEICNNISVACEFALSDDNMRSALVLIMVSLVSDVLVHGYDPCALLYQLRGLLDAPGGVDHTVILVMLAEAVSVCPANFLSSLMSFCEWLVGKGQCSGDSIWMLVVAGMPWLNCVSPSLMSAHRSITAIMTIAESVPSISSQAGALIANPYLPNVINYNHKISSAIQIARLCDELRDDNDGLVEWLKNIPNDIISDVYLLIGSLLISKKDVTVQLSALAVLQKAPLGYASQNLTFFLYQLGRELKPDGQLALLRAITATAIDKNNVPSVIFTIKTIQKSNEPLLQILSIDLYLRLWDIEERCYPLLLSALTEDQDKFKNTGFKKQMNIACASGFYHICSKKPEKHGKELVEPIQNLLVQCQDSDGVLPSSFLIKALAALINAKVLSASSTWNSLQPLIEDMRSAVCVSMCELVEAAVHQRCTEEGLNSMCSWLWKIVSTCKANYVVHAALRTLKKIPLETIKFKSLPESYRKNVSLPDAYKKNPATADRRPEDVLEAIPGTCWVQFLKNIKVEARQTACETLAVWLDAELKKYRGGVYDITYGEPQNYDKLAYHSVCRGLVEQLRRVSSEVSDESNLKTEKLILDTLCIERSKSLPPISWNFLITYFQFPELKESALSLAAKESKGSISARTIIENYINTEPHTEEKDKFLFSRLTDLAKGVPPKTLQNLMARTLKIAYMKKDDVTLRYYLKHLKETLQKRDIHEANRTLLCQQIKGMWEEITLDNPVIEGVLDCAITLPLDYMEMMSSATVMWEVTMPWLQKSFKLRCRMSQSGNSDTPFTWLNECIENAIQYPSEQTLLLTEIEETLRKMFEHETAWPWVTELLGKMSEIAYKKGKGLDFVCSILILAVGYISKFSTLSAKQSLEEQQFYFPLALKILLTREKADTKKISDQLTYILKTNELNKSQMTSVRNSITAIS